MMRVVIRNQVESSHLRLRRIPANTLVTCAVGCLLCSKAYTETCGMHAGLHGYLHMCCCYRMLCLLCHVRCRLACEM
jgi:hypothetical protein